MGEKKKNEQMKIKMEKRKTPQKWRETPTSGHFRSGPLPVTSLPVAPPRQIPLENLLYTKNDLENMEEKQVE